MRANLWDAKHPYHCTEGNYHLVPNAPLHRTYDSWTAFREDWVNGEDHDYNLLWRWDWVKETEKSLSDMYFRSGPGKGKDRVVLFYVMQRKGYLFSVAIPVTDADQPQVREYLEAKGEHMRKLWEPILDRTIEEELEALI